MNRKDMLLEFKKIQDRNMTTVRTKNQTYGADGDAFQAFKDAVDYGSRIETQPQALWNMMSKHLVTVKRWVDEGVVPSEAEAAEKLGDIAIYFGLLELMWKERIKGMGVTGVWFDEAAAITEEGKSDKDCKTCGGYGADKRCYNAIGKRDITGKEFTVPMLVQTAQASEDYCGPSGKWYIKRGGKDLVLCVDCVHISGGTVVLCDITNKAIAFERSMEGVCGPHGDNFHSK